MDWKIGFPEPIWEGYPHDGYPLCSIHDYPYAESIGDGQANPRSQHLGDDAISSRGQSWLIFGLLEAVTEQKYQESDLVTDGYLRYSKMYRAVKDWSEAMRESGQTPTTTNELLIADRFIRNATQSRDRHKDESETIVFAAALGEALSLTLFGLPFAGNTQRYAPNGSLVLHRTPYPQQMIAQGWCALKVEYLVECGIAVFGQAFARRQPPEVHPDYSHSHCVFDSIDPAIYQPQHVQQDCSCENAKHDIAAVLSLLGDNSIPVITPQLDVVDSHDQAYIAISHVWRHGLGSTANKGLPRCQINRIIGLVSACLTPRTNFWIDSLCVPEETHSRVRAIGLITQTFQEAAAVIVLDNLISGISTNDSLITHLW